MKNSFFELIYTYGFEIQRGDSSGRPIFISNAANVQKVKSLIDENCRLPCYELQSITGILKRTVHDIPVSHLGLRNVYFFWVPHKLSDINKAARVLGCIEQFLVGRKVPLVKPYSPDLNLLYQFMFQHIKLDLRGRSLTAQRSSIKPFRAASDTSPKFP